MQRKVESILTVKSIGVKKVPSILSVKPIGTQNLSILLSIESFLAGILLLSDYEKIIGNKEHFFLYLCLVAFIIM